MMGALFIQKVVSERYFEKEFWLSLNLEGAFALDSIQPKENSYMYGTRHQQY